MKKIILAIMAVFTLAQADGFIVGTELNYAKVNSELKASIPGYSETYTGSTKTLGIAFKGGYQFDKVKVYGVITSEKYKDYMVVENEGNAVSFGAEVDYMIENVFIGATLAKGTKDFNSVDIDFTDVGVRLGATADINTDIAIEGGVQYKKRSYDSYNYSGVDIGLDEKIIGVFVGLSFNL